MPSFTLSVTTANFNRYKVAKLALYPNTETVPDPDYVGDQEYNPGIPKYTDNEWLKEMIRRGEVRDMKRGEKLISDAATAAAALDADSIIT